MSDSSTIKFAIQMQYEAASAIGRATQDTKRYAEEIRKLKAAGDQTAEGQLRLGQAIINYNRAVVAQKDALRLATQGQEQYRQALLGVADGIAAQAGPLGGMVRSLSGANLALGIGAGLVLALAGAIAASTKGMADYQEKMDLLSASTGFTTRELAGLKLAATENGRSFDQLRPALEFFSRKLADAEDSSSETAKTFRELGVTVKDAEGNIRPVGAVFREVQQGLIGMEAGAQRSKIAFELFGRGAGGSIGALLTPMDQVIDRAEAMGLVLGPEMEAMARKTDTAIDHLGSTFEGFALRMQGGFLPIGLKFLETIDSWLAALNRLDEAMRRNYRMELGIKEPGSGTAIPKVTGDMPTGAAAEYRKKIEAEKFAAEELAKAAQKMKEALGPGALFGRDAQGNLTGQGIKLDTSIFDIRNPTIRPGVGNRPTDLFGGELPTTGGFEGQIVSAGSIKVDMIKEITEAQQAINDMVSTFRDSMANALTGAILGVEDLDAAFSQMFADLLGQVIQGGLKALIPLPFFQTGGTLMQSGGTLALRAQSGFTIASGHRGHDSVPVMAGRGETIVRHDTTDKLDRFLNSALQGSGTKTEYRRSGPLIGSVTLHVHGGDLPKGRRLEDWTSDNLAKALNDAIRSGRVRL